MRVCIIGCGNIAALHCPIILKQADTEIVGVADRDLTRAKDLSEKFNVKKFYQDAEDMIDTLSPDVIHILTPPQYHAEAAITAMEHGCHVFVEKPMALRMDDAEKMVAVSRHNNVCLCVGHNLVFEDIIQNIKKIVSRGDIGEIVSVESNFVYDIRRNQAIIEEGAEYCHWSYRMNGGPLEDFMPHPVSLIMDFLPDDAMEVSSMGYNRGLMPGNWQDEIKVLIKSGNCMGYISVSLNEKPDITSLTIKGTKGTIKADLFSRILIKQRTSFFPRFVARGFSGFQISWQFFKGASKNIYKFMTGRVDKSNGREALLTKFYETIQSHGEPPISLDKSLAVVDIINRIWPKPVSNIKSIALDSGISNKTQTGLTSLVTGASGFIGFHLVKKLMDENVGVRALVRPNSFHAGRLKKIGVEIIEGDLSDSNVLYKACNGVNAIFHAGFPVGGGWEECEDIAVKGTKTLIEYALENRVERFIYLSSLNVYEILDIKNKIIKESSPFQKNIELMGPYTWAKIECEKLLFDAYKNRNLKITILRPGIVIGPLGRIFFPHLGFRYQDKIFLLIGKGNNILPLTYVENTVDAIYKASFYENAVGQAFNIVDNGEITPKIYLEQYVKTVGNTSRIIQLPYFIPYLAAAAYEAGTHFKLLKKGVTSRKQLKWKQTPVRFDSSKAKKDLEWEPAVSLMEGLHKTFEWHSKKFL